MYLTEKEWKLSDIKIPKSDLNLPRKSLPNISADQYPAFFAWLKEQGVKITKSVKKIKDVKPSQGEFNPERILSVFKNKFDSSQKPAILSKDNYILDGHHRYAAAWNMGPTTPYHVIQIDLNIKDLIKTATKFPGAKFKGNEMSAMERKRLGEELERIFKEHQGTIKMEDRSLKRMYRLPDDMINHITQLGEDNRLEVLKVEVSKSFSNLNKYISENKEKLQIERACKNIDEAISKYANAIDTATSISEDERTTRRNALLSLVEETSNVYNKNKRVDLSERWKVEEKTEVLDESIKTTALRGLRKIKRGLAKAGITKAVNARDPIDDKLKTSKERFQKLKFKRDMYKMDEEVLDEEKVGHYTYKIDKMGHVTLTNTKTKKSAYLQGDDALSFIKDVDENENFWKLTTSRQMAVIDQFDDIMEDVEQIDELSKDTLQNYKKKAQDQIDKTPANQHVGKVKKHQLGSQTVLNYWNKKYQRGMTVAKGKPGYDKNETLRKRRQGVETANKKLGEETINELSTAKLKDYEEKASKDFQNRASANTNDQKLDNRIKGVELSFSKRRKRPIDD